MLDVGLHERRRDRRMQDPEYRAAYERAAREVAQTDAVIRQLDLLRVDLGISKAELARREGVGDERGGVGEEERRRDALEDSPEDQLRPVRGEAGAERCHAEDEEAE